MLKSIMRVFGYCSWVWNYRTCSCTSGFRLCVGSWI